jgi:hypothetical protein
MLLHKTGIVATALWAVGESAPETMRLYFTHCRCKLCITIMKPPPILPSLLLLVFFAPHNLYADNAATGLPGIKVAWKPSFGEKSVTLSITNIGKKSFKISSELAVGAEDNDDSTFPLPDPDPGTIYPILEFMAKPGREFNQRYGGIPPLLIEVKPGETKIIKFTFWEHTIGTPATFDEAHLLLRLNGRDFNKVVLKKKDGVWKE